MFAGGCSTSCSGSTNRLSLPRVLPVFTKPSTSEVLTLLSNVAEKTGGPQNCPRQDNQVEAVRLHKSFLGDTSQGAQREQVSCTALNELQGDVKAVLQGMCPFHEFGSEEGRCLDPSLCLSVALVCRPSWGSPAVPRGKVALPRSGHSLKCTGAPICPQQRDFPYAGPFSAWLPCTCEALQADALGAKPGCGCHTSGSVNALSTSIRRDPQRLGQAAATSQVPYQVVWLLAGLEMPTTTWRPGLGFR